MCVAFLFTVIGCPMKRRLIDADLNLRNRAFKAALSKTSMKTLSNVNAGSKRTGVKSRDAGLFLNAFRATG